MNNYYEPNDPYFLENHVLETDDGEINCLSLFISDTKKPAKRIIGISKTEKANLNALISSLNIKNSALYINFSLDSEVYLSYNDINYYKQKIGIVGENSSGMLNLYFPANDIYLYSLDGFIFSSVAYTQFVPTEISVPTIENPMI
jgi:hypothetical protein